MPALRSVRTGRSLTFISTLLLTTALAAPAFAQIEEVIVTAQKRAEDVQTVPIAISAFTAEDLKAQQISQFKDLQFAAPNVTYTAGQFGGADFQIRGIGVTAVGYDSESGIAINQNEVYLATPQLTEGSFYDIANVEVLAGPQTTLYGRGATGGAVNINFATPDLDKFGAFAIGSYGNYDAIGLQGMVNIPVITDQLAVRLAGDWVKRDGFVNNIYNGSQIDGRDDFSLRGSVRWEPTDRTTIDFTGQFSREDDSHMRSQKQLCTTDPTGVLGCDPDSAGTEPVNSFSNQSVIASSQQGMTSLLSTYFGAVLPPAEIAALGRELGIFNLASVPTLPPGYVDPSGARQVSTDFTPLYHSQDNFMSAKWTQQIVPWLTSTMIGGYDQNSYYSEESYNNIPGDPLPSNTGGLAAACGASLAGSPNVQCASASLLGLSEALYGGLNPAYASYFAPYFAQAGAGALPFSKVQNLGIIGGDYTYTDKNEAFDQSDGNSSEYSGEWRFNTNFTGPLNAMLGVYYLHTHVTGDYYVSAPTLDYPGIALGALLGPAVSAGCLSTGCVFGPSYYHNYGAADDLTSKSVYGELYYDLIPDTLKLTGGLRYTDDQKYQQGRIAIYENPVAIGTTSENAGVVSPYDTTNQEFKNLSGHITADWTPTLDFTDQTLVYATFTRGYKAGGANPGIEPGDALGIPSTYSPEHIDAYELGTKNQVLNNSLQLNGDVYYYNYQGLQVSTIFNNTSVNENINAKLYGEEGQFLWVPDDRWQFGLNVANENSQIGNVALVDQRNPTGGDPNTLLIKDDTLTSNSGNNCVLYYTGAFPGLPAGFTAPAAGIHALASQGIANAAFGQCPLSAASPAPAGYSWTDPAIHGTAEGVPVSLNGNELQNTPQLSVSLSGQYTQPLGNDYNLVARLDYHWQSHMWGRIWEDGADLIKSEDVMNASVQLNSLTDAWYVKGFIKNIFNRNNITGEYLASPTSGLYTNAFYGDPRTYGVEAGITF